MIQTYDQLKISNGNEVLKLIGNLFFLNYVIMRYYICCITYTKIESH